MNCNELITTYTLFYCANFPLCLQVGWPTTQTPRIGCPTAKLWCVACATSTLRNKSSSSTTAGSAAVGCATAAPPTKCWLPTGVGARTRWKSATPATTTATESSSLRSLRIFVASVSELGASKRRLRSPFIRYITLYVIRVWQAFLYVIRVI